MVDIEKPNYCSFRRLSKDLTQSLIEGDTSPVVINGVQTELQAYFPIDAIKHRYFGGVLYHPDGKGPEKPYFKPEGDDWKPEVQAVSRIGVQFHYWDMLYKSLERGAIDPVLLFHFDVLVLHASHAGTSELRIDSTPERVKVISLKASDWLPRYSSYIPLVNYGGDADFYGPYRNKIFPMQVRTAAGETVFVERATLDISEEMTQQVWQSRENLYKIQYYYYARAILTLLNDDTFARQNCDPNKRFPDKYYNELRRILELEGNSDKSRTLLERALLIWTKLDDDEKDLIHEIIDGRNRENMTIGKLLLPTAKAHADNLFVMYEEARNNCGDIYPY